MNQSINDYRFVSDEEPGDKRLHMLMREVAADARDGARRGMDKLKADLKKQLHIVMVREGNIPT